MVALFRDVGTDEPRAVSRTFFDREGVKIALRFLGPVGGAAIKLDADEDVLGGLHIGEGVETVTAARMLGLNSPLMKSRFFSFASGLWRG